MAGAAAANGRPSAGGVVLCGRRVLVIHKRLNGEWRLPKGRVDAGEDRLATALREVAEETGFADLECLADLGSRVVEYQAEGQLVRRQMTFYAMRPRSFARCERDRRDALRFGVYWMDVDEALGSLTFDDEREWLRQALAAVAG